MNGDDGSAILDYSKAIEINGRYAVAYVNRGSAFEAKSDHDLAIADYSKAIEINPHDAEAYYGRAIAMLHKGDRDGAIADYTKAIEISPGFAEAYVAAVSSIRLAAIENARWPTIARQSR